MRKKLTQRALGMLVKRQRSFLERNKEGAWVLIAEAPWYRFTAPERNPAWLEQQDLAGLDLRGLELPCANLRLVRCANQDLTLARLDGSLMREAGFTGSLFRRASLRDVDLTGARLEGCDFTDADLAGAELENAVLTRALIDWDAIGRGRFLVQCIDGLATGGYGEMEQDYTWTVTDQASGRVLARYDGHSYKCFFSSDPTEFSGVVGVRISRDARRMTVTHARGETEELDVPRG